MASSYTEKTPDYSPLIVHFTKKRKMEMGRLIKEGHPLYAFRSSEPFDKLMSILQSRTIHASPMPWVPDNPPAVCFTECLWDALTRLASSYSSYGVVFRKDMVFRKGGGPVLYVRGDIMKNLWKDIPPSLVPFIMPFDPEAVIQPGVRLDFLHEREWRLPDSLKFEFSDIQYVIVQSLEDARRVVHQIGAQYLPEEKLIPMEVYEHIRKAWSE